MPGGGAQKLQLRHCGGACETAGLTEERQDGHDGQLFLVTDRRTDRRTQGRIANIVSLVAVRVRMSGLTEQRRDSHDGQLFLVAVDGDRVRVWVQVAALGRGLVPADQLAHGVVARLVVDLDEVRRTRRRVVVLGRLVFACAQNNVLNSHTHTHTHHARIQGGAHRARAPPFRWKEYF